MYSLPSQVLGPLFVSNPPDKYPVISIPEILIVILFVFFVLANYYQHG